MISSWLKMRGMQAYRLLISIGWLWIVALPIFLGFFFGLLENISQLNPNYWLVIVPIIILSVHFYRKDGRFLKIHFTKKEIWQLLFAEYSAAAWPLYLIFGFVFKNWWVLLVGQAAILCIIFLPISRKSLFQRKSFLPLGWIPADLYEWRYALRKYGVLFILIWAVGFLGFWYIGATLLSLILFTLFFISAFEVLENKEMLLAKNYTSSFAQQKALRHFGFLNLVFLPHHLISLGLYSQYWYIWLAVVIVSGMIISFAIFVKYTSWMPKRRRIFNNTQVAIFCLFGYVPFFWPVAIGWLVMYYRRAVRRMNYFFLKVD